eukprot:TRINITY_DN9521_c0_g1_i1.p1 TRINITY_DN9521_c0_g1~~TRINITY_DN9521_c0_g1_i1.p1  ORF type:complete len:367 (+),score=41.88 TRINITY_DN9521_c0_g1_i1:59-1159(+)
MRDPPRNSSSQRRRRREEEEKDVKVECGECGGMTDKRRSTCMVCGLPYVTAVVADFDCGELGEESGLEIIGEKRQREEVYAPVTPAPPPVVPVPVPVPMVPVAAPVPLPPVPTPPARPTPPPVTPVKSRTPQPTHATPPTPLQEKLPTPPPPEYVPEPFITRNPIRGPSDGYTQPAPPQSLAPLVGPPPTLPPSKRYRTTNPDTASVKIRPTGIWQVYVTGFPYPNVDINEAKQIFPKATTTIADEPYTGYIDFKTPFDMRDAMASPQPNMVIERSWRTTNDPRIYYQLIGSPAPTPSELQEIIGCTSVDPTAGILEFDSPIDVRKAVARFIRRYFDDYPRCYLEFTPFDKDVPPTDEECRPYQAR